MRLPTTKKQAMDGLLYISEIGVVAGILGLIKTNVPFFIRSLTLLRKNMILGIFKKPGAQALKDSPGEAISRFRGDTFEIPLFSLWMNDFQGLVYAGFMALGFMIAIDPKITLFAVLPFILVGLISAAATNRIDRYRRASRRATGIVLGFISELFTSVRAVQASCAEKTILRKNLMAECNKNKVKVTEISTIIENENDVLKALDELKSKSINSLIIYLGNFGPEIPAVLLARRFEGPVMIVAAAEESGNDLINGRGDAYCGMLNTSYNCGLRNLWPYIPEYPVGTPAEIIPMIHDFIVVARILLSLRRLKIFLFGPRPQDFIACNAPIKPLFDLGIEIMENSELDLFEIYNAAQENPGIGKVVEEMKKELASGNTYPPLLSKLAQYEIALTQFMEKNLGACDYGIFANKCWPAFEKYFGFVPCYINSRLATKGIPISCEVDIYGSLSEYIGTCATELSATILDINNTVPYDTIEAAKDKVKQYKASDMFMGFHCGNTPSCFVIDPKINYQLIMHRLMEPEQDPDITRGTLEGRLIPGNITIFRLQSTADTQLKAYIAQGEVLPVEPQSFGGIGVIGINEMARFYRHVLIEKRFPHHTAVAFKHIGKYLFSVFSMLGINDVSYNKPKGSLYTTENPF